MGVGPARRCLHLGLVLVTVTAGMVAVLGPRATAAQAPTTGPVLSVTPASGPVGSVVTVRATGACGSPILFGPAGGDDVSALGYGDVVSYVIPSFVGDPAVPVTAGRFEFAENCLSTAGTDTPASVPFVVTGGPSPDRFVGMAATPDGGGYWLAQADGGVRAFGNAGSFGSLTADGIVPAAPITGIAATSDGQGYWLVGADGGVFSFGDAVFHGSLPALGVSPFDPVVSIAATADNGGYWLMGADGGLFAFGDAPYCLPGNGIPEAGPAKHPGELLGLEPTVAVSAYPGSNGYAFVDDAGNGFVEALPGQTCSDSAPDRFTLGAAIDLPAAVTGLITAMAVIPHSGAVWIVGSDGGVFASPIMAEGTGTSPPLAPFFGSLPGLGVVPDAPIVGISSTPDGGGYWLLGADGGVFSFGDAVFHGSAA